MICMAKHESIRISEYSSNRLIFPSEVISSRNGTLLHISINASTDRIWILDSVDSFNMKCNLPTAKRRTFHTHTRAIGMRAGSISRHFGCLAFIQAQQPLNGQRVIGIHPLARMHFQFSNGRSTNHLTIFVEILESTQKCRRYFV